MFHRDIQEIHPGFLRYTLLGPNGAMSFTAVDVGDHISGDISYHIPCFDTECGNTMEHGACDIFGEAFCHSSGRSLGKITTMDDEPIFSLLESLYETDILKRIERTKNSH